jgi:hypothetical protein
MSFAGAAEAGEAVNAALAPASASVADATVARRRLRGVEEMPRGMKGSP